MLRGPHATTNTATLARQKIRVAEDLSLCRTMLVLRIKRHLGITVCGDVDNIKVAMAIIEPT